MKIVKLTAENVKRLQAVHIEPTGDVVVIAGRNGQGKTSVLDSIYWALDGTKAIQSQPIRKGQRRARIKLDLGELIVERKFSEAGSTLSVESAEGARFGSPQKMLDALLGELAFDPLAFARMPARQQFDELRRIAKLEVDVDKLDGLNRSDYEKRTEINREGKAKRAQADAITVPPKLPAEPIDDEAIVDRIQEAGESNAQLEQHRAQRLTDARGVEALRAQASRDEAEIAGLQDQIANLQTAAQQLQRVSAERRKQASELEAKINTAKPLPEPIDVRKLRDELDAAHALNAQIQQAGRRAALIAEAQALETRAQDLTDAMDAREKAKADAIAAAAMPVPGLGFGDGAITFNGIPFDQASSAEQLRVSMAIAMAANPRLRIIRITDGSLLDADSLAAIGEMARAGDYQVWLEVVDASGQVGIVIEDGAVVKVNPPPGGLLGSETGFTTSGAIGQP